MSGHPSSPHPQCAVPACVHSPCGFAMVFLSVDGWSSVANAHTPPPQPLQAGGEGGAAERAAVAARQPGRPAGGHAGACVCVVHVGLFVEVGRGVFEELLCPFHDVAAQELWWCRLGLVLPCRQPPPLAQPGLMSWPAVPQVHGGDMGAGGAAVAGAASAAAAAAIAADLASLKLEGSDLEKVKALESRWACGGAGVGPS